MPNYGDKSYWMDRYDEQNGTTFDWLEDYESVKPILKNLDISKDELESLVNKNRLIRDEETSLIRRGFSNEEVSGSAGHQTVRLSNIGTLEDVIAFNKDGTLKERGPLITQLSSTAGVNGLSDNQKAKENIRKKIRQRAGFLSPETYRFRKGRSLAQN